jgi:DNA-binding transcriptional MerR regulator
MRLALILQGRRLGFTLAEIYGMVAECENGGDLTGLPITRVQCIDQIMLLERQKRDLDEAIAELRRIFTSFYAQRGDGSNISP